MAVPRRESITIDGPAGNLQAVLEWQNTPQYIAVVCHPHPLYQGSMNNKVVTTVARELRGDGAAVVRFNYRGVGESEGTYGGGDGEAEDLLAVVAWLRSKYPQLPLRLAGFSFGTYVAASGAFQLAQQKQSAVHLLLIAPSVKNFDFSPFTATHCPVLVIQGEDDDVVSPTDVYQWAQQTPLYPTVLRMAEAEHFFHGQLPELAELIRMSSLPL